MSTLNPDTIFISPSSNLGLDSSIVTNDTLKNFSDSIIIDTNTQLPVSSMLEGHNLPLQNSNPVNRSAINSDWITGLILATLLLLAFARITYSKRLQQVFYSFFSVRYQNIMERDGSILKHRILFPLAIVYVISFSLFIVQLLWYFFPSSAYVENSFTFYLSVALGLFALVLIKNLCVLLYGNIFKSNYVKNEIIVSNFIFNMLNGIFLLPIVILYTYISSPIFIYIGFFFWLLTLAYKILRQSLIRLSDQKFSYFNRFIYLCTFEIAPTAILIKLVISALG